MKIKLFRIISAVLLVFVMVTIFMFSSQKATDSQQTSDGFISKVISVFYPEFNNISADGQEEIIDSLPLPVRKVAHFSIYFVMGLFSFCTFVSYKVPKFCIKTAISFAVCVLFSISDEIHQLFVPGRSCELRDVIIDSCGALFAIIICVIICKKSKRIKFYNI